MRVADQFRMTIGVTLALLVVGAVVFLLVRSGDDRVSMPSHLSPITAYPSIDEHLQAGRKIDAIKLYRAEHGVGLKEAKDAIEALQRKLPSE